MNKELYQEKMQRRKVFYCNKSATSKRLQSATGCISKLISMKCKFDRAGDLVI